MLKKSGEMIYTILNPELVKGNSSEIAIELNIAMIEIKHTIKKTINLNLYDYIHSKNQTRAYF